MTTKEKQTILSRAFEDAKSTGLIRSQRDFAAMLKCSEVSLSKAIKGDEKYLTESFVAKVQYASKQLSQGNLSILNIQPTQPNNESVLIIPTEAMAGTLGEFAESVSLFDCERIVSPIKGADYAIKVHGDSMSPEYPSGSIVLIKKVNEQAFIEWGKVYVLDTDNGAVIKSVRNTELESVIECVSANPAYQPFRVNTKYIRGWYRVLMVLSAK